MSKAKADVININDRLLRKVITYHPGQVCVLVLHIDGKKVTKSMFEQIPVIELEKWPDNYFGWVQYKETPWLIWLDGYRLVRSNVKYWYWTRSGSGEWETPATEGMAQIYI